MRTERAMLFHARITLQRKVVRSDPTHCLRAIGVGDTKDLITFLNQ